MANRQYTVAAGDRGDDSSFSVPGDEPGTDDSMPVDQDPGGNSMRTYAHIENGFDVSVDVTLQGGRYDDPTLTAPVDDGATETIASGENGAFDTEVAHSYAQISVNPSAQPTSGELVVTFQTREQ